LCIETGRWKKPICTPLDERKCILCYTVEDEFHYVCECKMNYVIRKTLVLLEKTKYIKFIEFIKSDSKDMINKLGCAHVFYRFFP